MESRVVMTFLVTQRLTIFVHIIRLHQNKIKDKIITNKQLVWARAKNYIIIVRLQALNRTLQTWLLRMGIAKTVESFLPGIDQESCNLLLVGSMTHTASLLPGDWPLPCEDFGWRPTGPSWTVSCDIDVVTSAAARHQGQIGADPVLFSPEKKKNGSTKRWKF